MFDSITSSTERTADVIVVGSGAAGYTAAVTARLMGLDVLLLEKSSLLGGITAISGGGIWVPMSPTALRLGVDDTMERARRYFRSVTGVNYDERRSEAFLQAGPEMIDMLERKAGMEFYVARDRPDYYDTDGSTTGTRTIFPTTFNARRLGKAIRKLRPPLPEMTFLGMMMRPASDLHHFLNALRSVKSFVFVMKRLSILARDLLLHGRSMELAGGNALIGQLMLAGELAGLRVQTSANVRRLRMSGGKVSGVVCDINGKLVEMTAARGVILAAGGFSHNAGLRKQLYSHAPTGQEHLSPAPAENTGDGISMALEVGAVIPRLSDAACWAPVSLVPHKGRRPAAFPHLIDRQKPGFIAVTPQGRRFTNESHSYHEFGRGLRRTGGDLPLYCWLIADHRAARRFGMGFAKPAPIPISGYVRMGYLRRGDTLEALAQKIGVPATTLRQTVERFNTQAREGVDTDFDRGNTPYNRYLGDRFNAPNPCLAPLETGPFYAIKLEMGELGTFEGLATDENANVLNSNGDPIGNLYAVGNDMSHVMGGHYLGGGAAIGPGMTFGYIAARHIAGANRT